jgi:hypothetical protein
VEYGHALKWYSDKKILKALIYNMLSLSKCKARKPENKICSALRQYFAGSAGTA